MEFPIQSVSSGVRSCLLADVALEGRVEAITYLPKACCRGSGQEASGRPGPPVPIINCLLGDGGIPLLSQWSIGNMGINSFIITSLPV